MTGPGSVTFTVAENTGAARQATITVGSVVVTINQAAAPPSIQFAQPTVNAATVGASYAFQLSASGGVGTLRFSLRGGTFLPIGIAMDAAGRLSGTPIAPGTSTFGVCVTDDTARSVCRAITLLILKTVAFEPLHGWAIAQRIRQLSNDILQVQQGSLYPALQRLERQGWITAAWGASENNRRARFYRLTNAGKKRLEQEEAAWERLSIGIGLGVTRQARIEY